MFNFELHILSDDMSRLSVQVKIEYYVAESEGFEIVTPYLGYTVQCFNGRIHAKVKVTIQGQRSNF